MRENLQVAEIIAKGVGRGGVTNHCKWVIGRAPGHQRAGGSLTDDRARPPCNGTVRSPLRELGYQACIGWQADRYLRDSLYRYKALFDCFDIWALYTNILKMLLHFHLHGSSTSMISWHLNRIAYNWKTRVFSIRLSYGRSIVSLEISHTIVT